MENTDPERFYNFIVNIFDVVLEGASMLPPHAILQLKPNIFLKVDVPVSARVSIPVCANPIYIHPSLELLHSHILHLTKHPLISRNTPRSFIAVRQDCLVFLNHLYPNWVLRVVHFLSTSIWEVISMCSNTPPVRLCILSTTAGPLWLNVSM